MHLELFSIRDSKVEAFNTPFFQATQGEALRSFMTAVNDPKSKLNQFPEDFDLWHVGSWNDKTGKIDPLESPKHISKAIDMVTKDQ